MTATASIHVHCLNLDALAFRLDADWEVLDPEEKARANRFRCSRLRNRWITARAGLRHILSEYCSSPPQRLRFSHEGNGKPVLAAESSGPGWHFNLSRSENLALLGITRLAAIGVDLEYQRTIPDWQDVARRFFSALEYRQLMMLPESQRLNAFYRCWTRKEAIVKATGEGLSASLRSFDVSLVPGEPAEVIADIRPGSQADRWRLEHLEVADDVIGALALRSSQDVVIEYHAPWPKGSRSCT